MMQSSRLGRLLMSPEALRFLVVGCSNFLVSFTVFRFMLATPGTYGFKTGIAQLVSYAAGVVWSYVWNRRFTFRASGRAGPEFARFLGLQVVLAGVSALAIDAVAGTGIIGPSAAWFVVMAAITVANFLACRLWVFRTNRKDDHAGR